MKAKDDRWIVVLDESGSHRLYASGPPHHSFPWTQHKANVWVFDKASAEVWKVRRRKHGGAGHYTIRRPRPTKPPPDERR